MKHLVALDFDGTIAATFEPSPSGVDVNVASRAAIEKLFGKTGLNHYDEIGGLQGREPGELIGIIQSILGDSSSHRELTQAYIDAKLEVIDPEISEDWPALLPGVKEFFQEVEKGRIPVDIAVVSSGHNGLTPPENLVTSDVLRLRPQPSAERPRSRYKPNPYQLAVAHKNWEHESGILSMKWERSRGKARMLYIGDDPSKDSSFAENARIPFGFVPFTTDGYVPDPSKGQFVLKDFFALINLLGENEMKLVSGQSFAHIVFKRSDYELFPSLGSEARTHPWLEVRGEGHVGSPERFL